MRYDVFMETEWIASFANPDDAAAYAERKLDERMKRENLQTASVSIKCNEDVIHAVEVSQ